jgi:hypothetical protein
MWLAVKDRIREESTTEAAGKAVKVIAIVNVKA